MQGGWGAVLLQTMGRTFSQEARPPVGWTRMERDAPGCLCGTCITVRDDVKKASDGLPARAGRVWTREKLTYLQKYASAFMTAMAPKRSAGKWDRLVYVDLLAGPGRDIDPDTG